MQSTSQINQSTLLPETLIKLAYQGFQRKHSAVSRQPSALQRNAPHSAAVEVLTRLQLDLLLALTPPGKKKPEKLTIDWYSTLRNRRA
ncbi:MAG: hypothetical protein F6K26_11385 [Moorea sp. SIO2I5]|nr:hypothetical protein [Moorena sp. SIO2I5]